MATKREVLDYIKNNLRKGYGEEQLRQALKIAGYSNTIIEIVMAQALKEIGKISQVSSQKQEKEKSPEEKKLLIQQIKVKGVQPSDEFRTRLEKIERVEEPEKLRREKVPHDLSPASERFLSAIGYPLGIVSLALLILVSNKNKFSKFHGFQALFWNLLYIIVYMITVIFIFPFIVAGGWPYNWFTNLISWFLWLTFIVLSIIFAVQAYYGRIFRIPIIRNLVPGPARM
jgi:uncharacterized membrane protein